MCGVSCLERSKSLVVVQRAGDGAVVTPLPVVVQRAGDGAVVTPLPVVVQREGALSVVTLPYGCVIRGPAL